MRRAGLTVRAIRPLRRDTGEPGVASAWARDSSSKEKRSDQRFCGAAERSGLSLARRTLEPVSAEDLERYETEIELQLYREYKDVLPMFQYVVETERRFYLANEVKLDVKSENGRTYFDLDLRDAWVWDMYRPTRFVADVHVVTFKDVNIEELPGKEL